MTIHKDRATSFITREENLNYLHGKINHALILLDNSECPVQTTCDYIVEELAKHGKDENQIRHIAAISKLIAQSLGYDDAYCQVLERAACLYDIGNIFIDEEIYAKEEALTFEEFNIVKNHTHVGHDFLSQYDFSITRLAAIVAYQHHEWWNGSGYPNKLHTTQIDMASRIVALADVVGALFNRRPGRENWDFVRILKYIEARKGLQFDPAVVDAFVQKKAKIYDILTTKSGGVL